MKLTNLIAAGLTATLLSTGVSYAQTTPAQPAEFTVTVKSDVIAQMPEVQALVADLKAQGFTYIEIRRTLLGRAKIMAYGADTMREIVLSSSTGEVLRNMVRAHDGSMAAGRDAMQAAKDNMQGNMGGNAGGNMGGNVGGNMGGNVGGNMGGNVGGNMGGNVGGNMGGNVGGNMGGNVGGNMGGMGGN